MERLAGVEADAVEQLEGGAVEVAGVGAAAGPRLGNEGDLRRAAQVRVEEAGLVARDGVGGAAAALPSAGRARRAGRTAGW